MTSSAPALVAMTGVEKRFGTTRALRGVDLSLNAGECLGLVGRNGAGKSTIVSILSGLAEPDAGQVRFAGIPAPRAGDVTRRREWIATVFQHSMIVPGLTVAENVFLGSTATLVNWRELRARTREIMRDWGFDIDADVLCRDLSVEQLQIVEIARALARGARCVLLDEPTAALERGAVRRLFERVRQLTAGGVAVLYISHHLEEVFEICQNVEVLRDGEMVLTAPTAQLTRDDLVAAMVGDAQVKAAALTARPGHSAPADRRPRRPTTDAAGVVLDVANLVSDSPAGAVRRLPAGARGRGRGRHRPAQRRGRHHRPHDRRRRTPNRRRGAVAGHGHPARPAVHRAARGHRLRAGRPPGRRVRGASRGRRERRP